MMNGGDVRSSIDALPTRFLADPHVHGRFRLNIGHVHRDVLIHSGECRVEDPQGKADVEICTDARTWLRIDRGELSGIEAFTNRTLVVRGSIEKSLQFEPAFERPANGGTRYEIERRGIGGVKFSTLVAGDAAAQPLVLLHGLGGTKASWITVVPQLARRYRVLAIDLPGFGASSKPWGRYDAGWFAAHVFRFLDVMGYESALFAGNSMGGRIAQEMAMRDPARVRAIACLCPATAFSRRPMLSLARLARAELGVLVTKLPRSQMKDSLRAMFSKPSRIEEAWYDAAIDDFLHVWKSAAARMAFFAAARNIYLEEPEGDTGFWARLADMQPPALYIFGSRDYLITSQFAKKVVAALPGARVDVWRDCGHVPQLEFPDRTATALLDFFGDAELRVRPTLRTLPRAAATP